MQLILLECRADATDITLKAQKKKKKQQLSISEPIRISRRIQIRKQQSVVEKQIQVQIYHLLMSMERDLFLWSIL